MVIKRLLCLATVIAALSACSESPSGPSAASDAVGLASVAAPKSTGAPTITLQQISVSNPFQCQTFAAREDVEATIRSLAWANADGSTRTKAHVQGQITFTNLVSGLVLTNDISFNEEVIVSADGSMVTVRQTGLLLKVRREQRGKAIAYRMGHSELTIDFSTSPPTAVATFNGREGDPFGGPCAALGDPAA